MNELRSENEQTPCSATKQCHRSITDAASQPLMPLASWLIQWLTQIPPVCPLTHLSRTSLKELQSWFSFRSQVQSSRGSWSLLYKEWEQAFWLSKPSRNPSVFYFKPKLATSRFGYDVVLISSSKTLPELSMNLKSAWVDWKFCFPNQEIPYIMMELFSLKKNLNVFTYSHTLTQSESSTKPSQSTKR